MKHVIQYVTSLLVVVVAVFGFSTVEASEQHTDKTLPAAIIESVSNYETSAQFQYVGNVNQLKSVVAKALEQLKADDPYTHLNLNKWQLSYKGTSKQVTLTFKFTYLTDAKKEAYVDNQVKKLAASITKGAKTDYDKVKAIHDYIVLNAKYDSKTKGSQYTAYTLLTEKKGVCQAYTALAYRLFEEAGVQSKVAVGKANKVLHSWNLVKIDGKWYHVDITFNDPVNNKANLINYNYFLNTDKEMKKTHSWTAKTLPAATSTKYAVYSNVTQAAKDGSNLHYYDTKKKKYVTLNAKTLKLSTSSATKYKNAMKK